MLPDLFSLHNKIALVTGASSGLGRNFALTMAKAGADIIIGARRADKLELVAQEIAALGRKAYPIILDITVPDSINHAVATAIAQTKHIDILVNNAGNAIMKSSLELNEAEWDSIIDTHLKEKKIC